MFGLDFLSFWMGFSSAIFIYFMKIIEEEAQLFIFCPSLSNNGRKMHLFYFRVILSLKLFGSYPNFVDDFWIIFFGPQVVENVFIKGRRTRSRGHLESHEFHKKKKRRTARG